MQCYILILLKKKKKKLFELPTRDGHAVHAGIIDPTQVTQDIGHLSCRNVLSFPTEKYRCTLDRK